MFSVLQTAFVDVLTLYKSDLLRSCGDAVLRYERVRPETVVFCLFEKQLSLERAVAAILTQNRQDRRNALTMAEYKALLPGCSGLGHRTRN